MGDLTAYAEAYKGDYVGTFTADTLQARIQLDKLIAKLGVVKGSIASASGYSMLYGINSQVAGGDSGGMVSAGRRTRPGPTDTIPMMVAPGEYIMRASVVDQFGANTFDALNAGYVPAGLGTGSPVGAATPGFMPAATGGTTTIVNNHYRIIAQSLEQAHVARSVRDAIESGARRGITP
ncbi:MAG: hypothetical protein ABL966_09790 [Acidimicrobiales bacterium]